jgi:protein-L-isoaspartate(D-aspartate) O-methyltransferase
MTPLAERRQFYAEEIQIAAGVQSEPLVRAFAKVPRERFLAAGPWQILSPDADARGFGYRRTPDADPRHLYHNVAIAIDPARQLNNGHPATLASWLDWLGLHEGDRVIHIGCGTGYYTAVMAEAVGPSGQVTAIEADAGLALRAADNLSPWNVKVLSADATSVDGEADVIFVNAGVTHALDVWLNALAEGGRMLMPVAFEFGPASLTKGGAVRVERRGDRYAAQWRFLLMIYACSVARDPETNQKLGKALASGTWTTVRSLRRDPHVEDASCWLHRDGSCLSINEA